ncbi:MAG TPA: radical SAM family heme chaperone HemW, partial [Chitinophagaceae bacterium]|nr:radical SAM family heme chaperone HemW [Chitinophagaceae bacterium]
MAGIYLHIPFCKQACNYCNFHFSTSLSHKKELINALLTEIKLKTGIFENETIQTIYFGGGTPSLLSIDDCKLIMERIHQAFTVAPGAEITLEANPDDISPEKLKGWKEAGINRLSIGIQSFFEEDLRWMNRAHGKDQALNSLQWASSEFENISLDLIYGTPLLTDDMWLQNIETALSFLIPHLSCYALTVEEKTPLQKQILSRKKDNVDADKQARHFTLLMRHLKEKGYEHYEVSNFALPQFRSRHNSSYWKGEKYLGLGPSAHSYNGISRTWNVANNAKYIRGIEKGMIDFETEVLTAIQKLNEYIM